MAEQPGQQILQDAPRPHLKIKVVVPTHDYVASKFAYCLASMMSHTTAVLLANNVEAEFGLGNVSGTYIHTAREDALQIALDEGVTHLLWIDGDMEFPKDALLRLLMRNKEMVGINYSTRGLPPQYVAIKNGPDGVKCPTEAGSVGLEEVEAIGFGLVLMDLRRLRKRLWKQPWFWFEHVSPGKIVGEDVYFCRKFREAGGTVFVDHDLSKECGHIGLFTYTLSHVHAWNTSDLGRELLEDGANH